MNPAINHELLLWAQIFTIEGTVNFLKPTEGELVYWKLRGWSEEKIKAELADREFRIAGLIERQRQLREEYRKLYMKDESNEQETFFEGAD